MLKNLTTNQLLLLGLAAVLLLLAAFSFFLLQNPLAPLPFSALVKTPSPTQTISSSLDITPTPIPPTRQTSYTPLAAFFTPGSAYTQLPAATEGLATIVPSPFPPSEGTPPYPPALASLTFGPIASTTVNPTTSRTPSTPIIATGTPATATSTFAPGEVGVTGRVIQNAIPQSGVILIFTDDAAPRQTTTGIGGHYSFVTLAPGTNFTIVFKQSLNPSLVSLTDITSMARIEGTLPIGINPINIPDLELSIDINEMLFGLQVPVDGAAYSASAISSSNPLQFSWSLYSGGGAYHVEVLPSGSEQPVWTSSLLASTSYMWDGTLDNGNHISQGTYWWRVSVTRSLANYIEIIYTQPFDLLFNP